MAIPGYSGVSGLFRFYRHPSYTRRKIKECLNRPSFHDDNQVCVLYNRIEKKRLYIFLTIFRFRGKHQYPETRPGSAVGGGGRKEGKKRGQIGKISASEASPLFPPRLPRGSLRSTHFFSPTPILSFFSQRGAWSQAKNQNRLGPTDSKLQNKSSRERLSFFQSIGLR